MGDDLVFLYRWLRAKILLIGSEVLRLFAFSRLFEQVAVLLHLAYQIAQVFRIHFFPSGFDLFNRPPTLIDHVFAFKV